MNRWRWTKSVLLLALALSPVATQAQDVRGTVLQEDSREPVSLALILLLDREGRTITQRLSDDVGRFEFDDVPAEAATLRAERIGAGVVIVPLDDRPAGDPLDLLLRVAPVPIEGIAVEAVDRCPADPRDEYLADAWVRFRPLLSSLQHLDRDAPRRYEMEDSESELSSTGDEVARMLTDTVVTANAVPFTTVEPTVLVRAPPISSMTAYRGRLLRVVTGRNPPEARPPEGRP